MRAEFADARRTEKEAFERRQAALGVEHLVYISVLMVKWRRCLPMAAHVSDLCGKCLLAMAKKNPATDWQFVIFQQLAKLLEVVDHPETPWRVKRPTAQAYRAAVTLISELPDENLPLPRIAPDREGGFQLEWEKGSSAVEISISPSGTLELLRSKRGRDREEGHVSFSTARDALASLARV